MSNEGMIVMESVLYRLEKLRSTGHKSKYFFERLRGSSKEQSNWEKHIPEALQEFWPALSIEARIVGGLVALKAWREIDRIQGEHESLISQ